MDGPVRVLLVAAILLSGCVGELLAPEEVTIRSVSCAFLDPSRSVRLVHHVVGPVSQEVIQTATASWVGAMAPVVGREIDGFSWTVGEAPVPQTRQEQVAWARAQRPVSAGALDLHVLWLDRLDERGRSVEDLSPAFTLINASLVHASTRHDAPTVARALLFHGLGHALGVVNRGIPLHDPDGPQREMPMHHESGSVMSASWHHLSTFPEDATARAYSDAVIRDWQHAQAEVCV